MKRLMNKIITYLNSLNKWLVISLYALITAAIMGTLHLLGITYDQVYKSGVIFGGVMSIYLTSVSMYEMHELRKQHKNNDRLREVCDHRINVSAFIIIVIFYIMNDVFK